METYPLDPQVKAIWSLSYIIRALVLSALVLGYEGLSFGAAKIINTPFGVLSLIVLSIGIIISLAIPPLKFKFWKFAVLEDEIYLERGIFTRIKTTAPFRRIQHIDVQQNIFERMMNLGKLVIYTAGTRGADIVIPGLPIGYAETLKEQLKNFTIEDAI